jgi:Fe-S-cluster containining protein
MSLSNCQRCGTCCQKGGPALHLEDLQLLDDIPMTDLVCLRRGELAVDPRLNSLQPLQHELLKIQGKDMGWECVYYSREDKSCTIYGHRPLECRSLFCADNDKILHAMDAPTLSRADLIPAKSGLWECIEEHEQLFPVERAIWLAKSEAGAALAISHELDEIIRLEVHFRQSLAEKVLARDVDLWVYLGRPLWLVLSPLNRSLLRYERM